MADLILRTEITKEKGFLYFCKEVDGKLGIFKIKAGRKKKELK